MDYQPADARYKSMKYHLVGRSGVRLDATGQYVEFTSVAAANSIVVRYVIPDAPAPSALERARMSGVA